MFPSKLLNLRRSLSSSSSASPSSLIGAIFNGKNEEEFEVCWINYFRNEVKDHFDLQRGIRKVFEYDIVPTIPILLEALRTCRRVDDYASSVKIFGMLRLKSPSEKFYQSCIPFLEPLKNELGINTPEELGRNFFPS